jgi:hypothetical protein
MAVFLSPGIYIREVETGGRAIIGVGTSTGAFIGLAERGPIGNPELITSFDQYVRIYGGFKSYSFLTYAVWGFFRNEGTSCWVVRTANYSDPSTATVDATANVKATRSLKDRSAGAGINTIRVDALDHGDWGNDLAVSIGRSSGEPESFNRVLGNDGGVFSTNTDSANTPALFAAWTEVASVFTDRKPALKTVGGGAAFALPSAVGDALYIGSKEKKFSKIYFDLDVSGVAGDGRWEYWSGTSWTTFTPATDQTTDFTAATADNRLVEFSAPGDWQDVEVNSVTAFYVRFLVTTLYTTPAQISRATLGEDRPLGVFTVVANASTELAAATAIGDAIYIGSNQTFGFVDVDLATPGDGAGVLAWEYWNGSIWTAFSGITETVTGAQHLTASGVVGFTIPTNWKKNSVNTETFYWARARIATNYASAYPSAEHVVPQSKFFSLAVFYKGQLEENYDDITLDDQDANYIEAKVGTSANPVSNFITVADLSSGSTVPNNRPRALILASLSGGVYDVTGVSDADYIGVSSGQTGLYAFDSIDEVNILAVPGIVTEAVHQAMLNYCEARKDLFAILDSPGDTEQDSPEDIVEYVRSVGAFNSTYGAIYDYWIRISDPITGARKIVPPSAFIAGMYARTDFNRGVYKAPAGIIDGQLKGALGLVYNTSQGERDFLYPARVNPIVDESGVGVYVNGARTLGQLSSSWLSIPVRRTFLFIEESIQEGIQFAKFEPNGPTLWRQIRASIGAFLKALWQEGGLYGDAPSDAFFITCDETNNPRTLQRTGRLVVRVGVAPVYPAEFIDVTFEVDERAINEELAAAGLL